MKIPIRHHPRLTGLNHCGVLNRLFVTIYDLFAGRWRQQRRFRFEVKEQINFPPDTAER